MTSAILTIVVLALLAILSGWLVTRAWRARRGYIKWPGTVLASLLTLLFSAVVIAGVAGLLRLSGSRDQVTAAAAPVAVAQVNSERVARWANGCAGCHSSTGTLPLDGSKENFFEGSPMGVLYAPNLTPGGPLKTWSDAQVVRAIREGVDKDGRPLVIMPSQAFRNLSDADAQALVSFLRSQPAVARDLPSRNLSLVPVLMIGAGIFPSSAQPPVVRPANAPPSAVSAEYGKYLVSMSGCADCHGPDLKGGQPSSFGPPAAPNLAAIVPQWKDTDFVRVIREGTDPSGRKISDEMPWRDFNKMFTDDELKAMHLYLSSLKG